MAQQSEQACSEPADPQNSLWFCKLNEWGDHFVLPQELLCQDLSVLCTYQWHCHLPVLREATPQAGSVFQEAQVMCTPQAAPSTSFGQGITRTSSLQAGRQLGYSDRSRGAQTLFCQFCGTERRRFLGFFPCKVSVHSRENLVLDKQSSYFHSIPL